MKFCQNLARHSTFERTARLSPGKMSDDKVMCKLFWKTLFQQEKIASKMHSISAIEEGVSFDNVGQFGKIHFHCRPASVLGDNFMSDTFIVTATTDDGGSFRGFIKVLPSNSIMQVMAFETKVYNREIDMYTTMFDQLHSVRQNAGLTEEDLPLDVPSVFYVFLDEKVRGGSDGMGTCVLMEDLSVAGYRMANKYEGCDDNHVRVSLQSLANYHALSIAGLKKWKDENGKLNFPGPLNFLRQKVIAQTFTMDQILLWLSVYPAMIKEGGRDDLAEWTELLLKNLDDHWIFGTLENMGPLDCVLHGDFWCNNMLFKYEDDKPTHLKMLDFQISHIGHPLYDILYFLYSSTVADVRQQHMNTWLAFYFNSLTTALKKLNAGIADYTFEDFMVDYKKRSIMHMFYGFGIMKMILDTNTVSGLENHNEEVKNQSPTEIEKPVATEVDEKDAGLSDEVMDSFMSATQKACDPEVIKRIILLADEVKNFLHHD